MAIRDGLANELRKKRKRLNVKRTSTGTGTRSVLLTLRITAAAPIPTRRLLYSIAVYVYVHSVRRQLGTLSDEFQFSKKLPSTTNAYSIFVTARFPKTHYVTCTNQPDSVVPALLRESSSASKGDRGTSEKIEKKFRYRKQLAPLIWALEKGR
ncbi:hypothetical protein V9T40_007444 [Parthenolecanium corni]|uniref:Uncharacterized protein n=1 Tax=Parthenolecanium corni TaxID=536013 RepID=A0AAN9YAS3_9HEMI